MKSSLIESMKQHLLLIVGVSLLVALWFSILIWSFIVELDNSRDPEYEVALGLTGSSQQEVHRQLGTPQLNLSFAQATSLESGERLFDGYVHIPLRPFHLLEVYRLEPGGGFVKPAIIVFYDSEYRVVHVDASESY